MTCGILVPQPGIEPGPLAVKVWSPNHRTAREFPMPVYFLFFFNYLFIYLFIGCIGSSLLHAGFL